MEGRRIQGRLRSAKDVLQFGDWPGGWRAVSAVRQLGIRQHEWHHGNRGHQHSVLEDPHAVSWIRWAGNGFCLLARHLSLPSAWRCAAAPGGSDRAADTGYK